MANSKAIRLLLFFLSLAFFTQSFIINSFGAVMSNDLPDSVKIDRLNILAAKNASIDPPSALCYADTAVLLSLVNNDLNRLAQSYNRRGIVLYFLGDNYMALENYFQALNAKESLGDTVTVWREYNNIGLALRNLEMNEQSLHYFKKSFKGVKSIGDIGYYTNSLNNTAIAYMGMKDYKQARELLHEALDINRKIDADQYIAYNYNNLGIIYFSEENYDTAIDCFEEAYAINRKIPNNYEQIENLHHLSQIYIRLNNFPKAKELLDLTYALLDSIKTVTQTANFFLIYSNYFERKGDSEQALFYKNKYFRLNDSLSKQNAETRFNQLQKVGKAEKAAQQIEFLKQINTLQDERLNVLRVVQIGSAVFILFVLAFLYFVWRNLMEKKRLYTSLEERNKQQEQLNEELNSQRDNLEDTLDMVRSMQKQLIQSEKMASIGVLASGVAHELNNPLNYILGGATGIKRSFEESCSSSNCGEMEFFIDSIFEGVNKATSIVKGLSYYSNSGRNIRESVDIHGILDSVLIVLNNLTFDRINIKTNFTDEDFSICGNIADLHQVFLAILLNAIQAIEGRGEITISSQKKESVLCITISDTGTGISRKLLSKIFDPFYTTKAPGEGTGLGLTVAYNVVNDHQGSIEIDSEPEKGSIVTVKLPLSRG